MKDVLRNDKECDLRLQKNVRQENVKENIISLVNNKKDEY